MDFFNIGGGELLVIILLALVLFRPEDIYKAMRTLGRYTRSARNMWNEFSANIKQEMDTREVEEALAETKTLLSSAEDAVSTLKTSVADVKRAVEGDVSAAGRSLKAQAAEGAAALKSQSAPAVSAVAAAVSSAGEAAAAIEDVDVPGTAGLESLGSDPEALLDSSLEVHDDPEPGPTALATTPESVVDSMPPALLPAPDPSIDDDSEALPEVVPIADTGDATTATEDEEHSR